MSKPPFAWRLIRWMLKVETFAVVQPQEVRPFACKRGQQSSYNKIKSFCLKTSTYNCNVFFYIKLMLQHGSCFHEPRFCVLFRQVSHHLFVKVSSYYSKYLKKKKPTAYRVPKSDLKVDYKTAAKDQKLLNGGFVLWVLLLIIGNENFPL